jgi:hypothetical protein
VEQQHERDYEGNPERWKKASASERIRTLVLEFGEQCVEQLPLLRRSHNGLGFFPPNEVLPYCIGKSIGPLYLCHDETRGNILSNVPIAKSPEFPAKRALKNRRLDFLMKTREWRFWGGL